MNERDSLLAVMSLMMREDFGEILQKSYDKNETPKEDRKDVKTLLKGTSLSNFMKSKDFRMLDIKANELNSTFQEGYGKEFVEGTQILATRIIDRLARENPLLSLIPRENIQSMLGNELVIPIGAESVLMRLAEEDANFPGTKIIDKVKTGQLVISTKKFMRTIGFTKELLEDSVINFMQYVENHLYRCYTKTINAVLVMGDKSSTGNINGTLGANDPRIAFDGLYKNAITQGAVVEGGTLETTDVRKARSLMKQKAFDVSNLVYLVDGTTSFGLLNLVGSQLENGVAVTTANGSAQLIDGSKVAVIDELPAGSILIVDINSIWLGFKRQFLLEREYDSISQQHFITGSFRYAQGFDNTDGPASALVRNITA